MVITEEHLDQYVNAAADLAEAVKRDVQRDGKVSNPTVLALNKFAIIANAIRDFTDQFIDTKKH